MYIEVPKLTRCCICVPLRYGLLIFGYLNVGFSLFMFGILIWLATKLRKHHIVPILFRGAILDLHIWLPILMYFIETGFNILLVVAAHLKSHKFFQIYFYYGILTTAATFISFLITLRTVIEDSIMVNLLTFSTAFSGLVVQAYLLILVKSEMKKLKHNQQLRFINHMIDGDLSRPPNGFV